MDAELFGIFIKGGPYALIGGLYIYMRLEFNRLQRERDTCQKDCNNQLATGGRKFDAIMEILTEVRTSVAFIQGATAGHDKLASQIADAINALRNAQASAPTGTFPRPGQV